MIEQFTLSEARGTESLEWLRDVRPFQSDDWSVRARGAVEKARVDLLLGEPDEMIASLPAFLGGAPTHRDVDTEWMLMVVRAVYGRALYIRDNSPPEGDPFLEDAQRAADHSIERPSAFDLEDAADLAAALRLRDRAAEAVQVIEDLAWHAEEQAQQAISWPWRVRYEYARALRAADRIADAERALRDALAIKPGEPNLLVEHAWCLGRLGDPSAGAKEAILAARGFYARERVREGNGAVDLASGLAPDWPPVLMIRAQRSLMEDKIDVAIALLDEAGPAMAGQLPYDSIRAWTLASAGRTVEALDLARMVLAERPSDWSMLFLAKRTLAPDDYVAQMLPLLERAREIDGDTAGLLFLTAGTYDGADQADEAREYYLRTLDLLPYYVECLQALGRLEGREGNYVAAQQAFERITAVAPANSEARFLLGHALRMQEDLTGALEAYTRAAEDLPEALTARGQVYLELDDVERGMVDLRAAAERAPRDPDVVFPYATALLKQDVGEATTVLGEWVTQSDDHSFAAYRAGSLLVDERFFAEALPFLREAATDPAHAEAIRPTLVDAMYELGDWQGVLDAVGSDLGPASDPGVLPPIAAAKVAHALDELGRSDDALRWAESAVARAPEHSGVLEIRGIVHRSRREFAAAEDDLRAALRADPENVWAKGTLGRVLRETGRPAEAAELLAQFVDAGLASPQVRAEYADALVLIDQATEALDVIESASAEAPDSPWVLGIYGTVLRALKRTEDALDKLAHAAQLPSAPAWLMWERVICLLQVDRVDEAVQYSRECIPRFPDDPTPRAALGYALSVDERFTEAVELLGAADVQRAAPAARGLRASALVSLGRHVEAVEELTDLLNVGADDSWTRGQLGNAYLRLQPPAPDEALEVLVPVADQDADLTVWLARGDAESLRGRGERARSCYEAAEAVGKKAGLVDAATLHGLGWIALKLGRPRDAVRLLNRAADLRVTASMLMDLGLATLQTSRSDEAIESYRRGLELIKSKNDDAATRGACLVGLQDLASMLSSSTMTAGKHVDEVRDLLARTLSSLPEPAGYTFTQPPELRIGGTS